MFDEQAGPVVPSGRADPVSSTGYTESVIRIRRRPRRRRHGRADCRALRQRRLPSLLLDVTADAAREGLKRARALKPDPFFTPDARSSSRTGGFDDDLAARRVRLDHRGRRRAARHQARAARAGRRARRPGIDRQLEHVGHPDRGARRRPQRDFRRHWLGTHFFNPPRYLHLLEVIPTRRHRRRPSSTRSRSSPIIASARASSSRRTRRASSPTTSALYGMPQILAGLAAGEYTIEEIDAITGPAIGRPKSATFRTLDIAGLDILRTSCATCASGCPTDASTHVRAAAVRRADARARADRREGRAGLLQAVRARTANPRS